MLVLADVRDVVDVVDVVDDTVVVVGSSRHPHQPGVLQVSVRVWEDVVGAVIVVIDGLVCVPFSNFQR